MDVVSQCSNTSAGIQSGPHVFPVFSFLTARRNADFVKGSSFICSPMASYALFPASVCVFQISPPGNSVTYQPVRSDPVSLRLLRVHSSSSMVFSKWCEGGDSDAIGTVVRTNDRRAALPSTYTALWIRTRVWSRPRARAQRRQ